jgi:medium-chain acyl-[acyl-carrier-protein] hydrolase
MRSFRNQAHRRNYSIRSYEVDAGGTMSVPSIFNLLQDAASSHAFELGVAVSQLMAENATWVLSRILLKMIRYPVWRDAIQVHTWPSGILGAFAFRDFDLRDETDRSIGCARSAWIVIDAQSRRPIRPTLFADRLKPSEKEPVTNDTLNKLPQPRGGDWVEKRFHVRYGDLDINQHVNNVSYIEWLLESIPGIGETRLALKELEINFLGEALQGDQVTAKCVAYRGNKNEFGHSVVREKDAHELIRARTVWR